MPARALKEHLFPNLSSRRLSLCWVYSPFYLGWAYLRGSSSKVVLQPALQKQKIMPSYSDFNFDFLSFTIIPHIGSFAILSKRGQRITSYIKAPSLSRVDKRHPDS